MKIFKILYSTIFYYYSRLKNILKYKNLRQNLYDNNFICELKITNSNEKKDLFLDLKKNYKGLISIQNKDFFVIPIAILKTTDSEKNYLSKIKSQSRNKINKALKNNVYCKIFNWNDYLDDIYEIHKSKPIRQGKAMSKSYVEYPEKIFPEREIVEIIHLGAFIDGKLIGYIEWHKWGNFAATNRLLGNGDFLKLGIMNLLFWESYNYAKNNNIDYLAYYSMVEETSLNKFKKNIGFQNYLICWKK